MKDVFHDSDPTRVGFARSILESEGIACFVRNENSQVLGQTFFAMAQPQMFDPTLCIADDRRFDEAVALLKDKLSSGPTKNGIWTCPACKEAVPSSFEICWNCGTTDPLLPPTTDDEDAPSSPSS